jgi:hypothetical protein
VCANKGVSAFEIILVLQLLSLSRVVDPLTRVVDYLTRVVDYTVAEVLRRIRVKLYPHYLPHVKGAYIDRTDNEALLNVGEVCAALKNRSGFTGNDNNLMEHEMAYQLCDGFAVDTGCFSVHPNIGGTFDKITEGHDTCKHPEDWGMSR